MSSPIRILSCANIIEQTLPYVRVIIFQIKNVKTTRVGVSGTVLTMDADPMKRLVQIATDLINRSAGSAID